MSTKRVPITVWLTPTELATIDRIAAEQQRPRSQTAVRLLNDALGLGAACPAPNPPTPICGHQDHDLATNRALICVLDKDHPAVAHDYVFAWRDQRTDLEREADQQAATTRAVVAVWPVTP